VQSPDIAGSFRVVLNQTLLHHIAQAFASIAVKKTAIKPINAAQTDDSFDSDKWAIFCWFYKNCTQ